MKPVRICACRFNCVTLFCISKKKNTSSWQIFNFIQFQFWLQNSKLFVFQIQDIPGKLTSLGMGRIVVELVGRIIAPIWRKAQTWRETLVIVHKKSSSWDLVVRENSTEFLLSLLTIFSSMTINSITYHPVKISKIRKAWSWLVSSTFHRNFLYYRVQKFL